MHNCDRRAHAQQLSTFSSRCHTSKLPAPPAQKPLLKRNDQQPHLPQHTGLVHPHHTRPHSHNISQMGSTLAAQGTDQQMSGLLCDSCPIWAGAHTHMHMVQACLPACMTALLPLPRGVLHCCASAQLSTVPASARSTAAQHHHCWL